VLYDTRRSNLFPVNSLFLYMLVAKTRNPCGFSRAPKKIPCYFPCYQAISLIVSLIDNLPLLPAQLLLQHLSIGADHVVEPANVGVHVLALLLRSRQNDLAHPLLNVPAAATPFVRPAAERHHVLSVQILSGNPAKEILVVDITRIACAVDQMDLFALMSVSVARIEEPLYKPAHWRDAGARGDQQRIA